MKMKKHKQTIRPTNDSERSPSVHYANWKETIFLRKKLATLNKTERGLVHRITVDQKVIFRRFQNMLSRSKLTQARVYNDREKIQELRSRDMRKLHCESHLCNQGNGSFLDKLEKNPFVSDADSEQHKLGMKRKSKSQNVSDEEMLELIQSVLKNEPIDKNPQNLRRLSALGEILGVKNWADNNDSNRNNMKQTILRERPLTSSNGHHKQNLLLENSSLGSKSCINVSSKNLHDDVTVCIDSKEDNRVISKISCNNLEKVELESSDEDAIMSSTRNSSLQSSDNILENLIDKIKVSSNNGNDKLLPLRLNAKISVTNSTKGLPKKAVSIFEEVKRPDVRGMKLQEAKKVDYKGQVHDFIEGLENFGHGVPDFDYYATKMQIDAALQVKKNLPSEFSVTPEEEYKKYTGDQTISCITLPKLKIRKAEDISNLDTDTYNYPIENYTVDMSDNSLSISSEEDET